MKIGTKLTGFLSLIIIVVLLGYGYFDILSRRDILIRKMKAETRSTGRTLKVSLEKIFQPDEMAYIQGLIDAVSNYERTLGVIVYFQRENAIFRSHSLQEDMEPYFALILSAIQGDRPQEAFGTYKKFPIFLYAFPLKDRKGKIIGGVSILQHTYFMEEELKKAKWNIFITIFVLIGGTVALVLFGTRKWVTLPISNLIDGVKNLARGNLDHRIIVKKGDELSELAQAFNYMSNDLKKARDRILREAETKLELERSLRQSEKLATIGQLATGLAHEVGTPLNIIYGRTELVKRKLEDQEEIHKNLDIILSQTERITMIIQQLLGFVRKKKPEQAVLNIGPFLETTLDLLDHQIKKQGITVMKELEDNLPVVNGDPDQLQQAFLNLLLNAIQSMPEGGIIRVTASPKRIIKEGLEDMERQYLEIGLEDTGTGMEKEVIQNIFNPFFTTKKTGTGLGLMVTLGILQDHEGWIDVESVVGRGSVFKVYLPVRQEEVRDDG